MNEPRKFLIIRLSSLGDILHTVPALQALRGTFPESQIDWVVEDRVRFLLSAVPGIDRIHALDTRSLRSHPWNPAESRRLVSALRGMRRSRYDFVLDFQGLIKTAMIGFASGARTRVGFSRELVRERPAHWFYHRRVGAAGGAHVVELNRRIAAVTGAEAGGPVKLDLRIAPRDEAAGLALLSERKLSDYVVINPGGGWVTKVWSPKKYGALARRVRGTLQLETVVTTGPGEEHLYDEIAAEAPGPGLYHARLSFLQLVPLLSRARLVIAGDTGPFHLACGLGTPVVGIFGPTSPARNGPWNAGEEVVVHRLPCSFCYGRRCPTQNECMDISVDEVFAAAARRLSATRPTMVPGGTS